MDGEGQSKEGLAKKSPLESLSREELIKKCKGLLGLAQKAKQVKDEYAEENRKLKEELKIFETQREADKKSLMAMKEVVDDLMENKVEQTSQISNLKTQISKYESEIEKLRKNCTVLDEANIENEALKRQVERLTVENDQLLVSLENMEQKLNQVVDFGLKQKEDLMILEKETVKWRKMVSTVEDLEKQLECSRNENIKLKERNKLIESEKEFNDHLQKSLEKEDYSISLMVEEVINFLNEQNVDNENAYSYKTLIVVLNKYLSCNEIIKDQLSHIETLRTCGEKQSTKLQIIRSKLADVTIKLTKLKKCKEVLLETLQIYCDSVPKWREEMSNVSRDLSYQIKLLFDAKISLEDKVRFLELELHTALAKKDFFEEKLNDLITYCDKLTTSKISIPCFENKGVQVENNVNCKKEIELDTTLFEKMSGDINETCDKVLINVLGITQEKDQYYEDQIRALEIDLQKAQRKGEFLELNLKDLIVCCEKVISEACESSSRNKNSQVEIEEHHTTCNNRIFELQENFNKQTKVLYNIQQEMKSIEMETAKLKSKLNSLSEENELLSEKLKEKNDEINKLEKTVTQRETENSDLLAEMRELNDILKARGEVISRQQDKILELEKEIKQAGGQLSERINTENGQLFPLPSASKDFERDQIEMNLRGKTQDTQSEILSVSTVSKAEESSRMREVDESFEEKYNKLKLLAIKLKKKVQEQATLISTLENSNKKSSDEKNDIKTKLGTITLQVCNLQALQSENDKLLDEIEKLRNEKLKAESQIKELSDTLKNTGKKESVSKLETDNKVKEYQNQIKMLKQEKENVNLALKNLEKEMEALQNEVSNKDQALTTLRQQHNQIKIELEKSKAAGKKSNVLNLEIEAYEKSLNETTQQLQTKQTMINDLEIELKSKDECVQSLKKQIALIEESLELEKTHSIELKQQVDILGSKFRESEHEKGELNEKVRNLNSEIETLKTKIDNLNLELLEVNNEKDKLQISSQNEKEKLIRERFELEEKLSTVTSKLKALESEHEDIKTDFANYKVRAQSILRQSQSKESSRERELVEEINLQRSNIEKLNLEMKRSQDMLDSYEKKMEELRQDNERIQKRCKQHMELLEETRIQNESILEDNRKHSVEYQEALKAHRLQIETLNNCYKKQIEDLEKKYILEIEELKKRKSSCDESNLVSRIGPFGGPGISDEQKIDLILMEREDAEGSETSVLVNRRKNSVRNKHDLVPLEELLSSSFDENIKEDDMSYSLPEDLQLTKDKLLIQENRVKHLTALLSEAEQDLAKLTQLNEMLKKEVRRYERSIEREKHLQNTEYLKNIVIKFLTLSNGDERSRLVPVLNTILKLSPEETNTLQNVAKGSDVLQRNWGSYLPIWSNHH